MINPTKWECCPSAVIITHCIQSLDPPVLYMCSICLMVMISVLFIYCLFCIMLFYCCYSCIATNGQYGQMQLLRRILCFELVLCHHLVDEKDIGKIISLMVTLPSYEESLEGDPNLMMVQWLLQPQIRLPMEVKELDQKKQLIGSYDKM